MELIEAMHNLHFAVESILDLAITVPFVAVPAILIILKVRI